LWSVAIRHDRPRDASARAKLPSPDRLAEIQTLRN
jgi:hypothetical protein